MSGLPRVLLVAAAGLVSCVLPNAELGYDGRATDVEFQGRCGGVRPRVLWVVDTSNSMRFRAGGSEVCAWNDCETPGHADESRISMLRAATHSTVERFRDEVDFGLMTFDQQRAPAQAPAPCVGPEGQPHRFFWARSVYGLTSADDERDLSMPISHYPATQGTWVLCEDNGRLKHPFPYLRWDDLGVGAQVSTSPATDAVPPSPVLDVARAADPANALRKVQWFPRFVGVRVNLNAATDPDRRVLEGSVGDYGGHDDPARRAREVWGQDFYYWPYVDGFVGYSEWRVDAPPTPAGPGQAGAYHIGVARGAFPKTFGARLYAPFFVEGSASGPRSRAQAQGDVLAYSDRAHRGGVDPSSYGITPWKDTIGEVPADARPSNDYDAHGDVASYVAALHELASDPECETPAVVLLTDGDPAPGVGADNYQGGPELYRRLADLRNRLGARVYVVGVGPAGQELNAMACAAAGACDGVCEAPCGDRPAADWDTCSDPSEPDGACAIRAHTFSELAQELEQIVAAQLR